MKHICTLILCAASFTAFSQIPGYTLLAHYPLTSNAVDAEGNYGDMTLTNAPFQDGGVYSNGIYNDGTNSGTIIKTPNISALTPNGFIVTCKYKITDMPTMDRPVLIIGSLWRWLAVWTDMTGNGQFKLVGNDGSEVTATGVATALDAWVDLKLTFMNGTATLNIGGTDIGTLTYTPEHNSDFTISCDHGGSSAAFKGLINHLNIYNETNVGISEVYANSDVSVYPNPVVSSLTVETVQELSSGQIEVFDITGKMIFAENLNATRTDLDMGGLKTGLYFVSVKDENGEIRSVKRVQKL